MACLLRVLTSLNFSLFSFSYNMQMMSLTNREQARGVKEN